MTFSIFVYHFIVLLCVCLCSLALHNVLCTLLARYSLFVLKVPLNADQPTNHHVRDKTQIAFYGLSSFSSTYQKLFCR